jgi:chemotaxis protein methyltransferase CheR
MIKYIDVEQVEIDLLLEAILRVYGYDFRHYARASLKRRLEGFLKKKQCQHYSELQEQLIHHESIFNEFLLEMSITVTEMFRDPHFYVAFREKIVPVLKTYPFVKIWHAGCATGEEVYSMAILLHEEGYLDKATIYATDFNNNAIKTAKEGIYSSDAVKQYTKNYNLANGTGSFSDYYHADYGAVRMKSFLKKQITWANHNLVTDKVFGEMNLIICRNVLIYFDSALQDQVYKLFRDSLCHRGFLCLGTKETLDFSSITEEFEKIAKKEKIYRKL